jgi:uncharacterized membrane-anchored protein YhcB (DUF1043 family)
MEVPARTTAADEYGSAPTEVGITATSAALIDKIAAEYHQIQKSTAAADKEHLQDYLEHEWKPRRDDYMKYL